MLTIGVCSYGNPDKLRATLESIAANTVSDYRLLVIHNPGGQGDAEARAIIEVAAARDARIKPVWMEKNVGYAGAVNELLAEAMLEEFVAYCDNDVEIRTPGWDQKLVAIMQENPEVGWVFPGPGHFGFQSNGYRECLWSAGYCWMMRMAAMNSAYDEGFSGYQKRQVFGFDEDLGHHEEVDFMIRLRLAGWRIACCPEVLVLHHETATHADSAVHKPGGRIHDGVVRWMNKWNRYFCGDDLKYSMTAYDPRALRYTDWPPDALYLERMTLHYFPDWNADPEVVNVPGVGPMHAVKVLKPLGPYKGRAI